MADFGDFDYKVKVFKRFVTVGNVEIRNMMIKDQKACDCWVNIPDHYKRFTVKDLVAMATSKYGADMFSTLLELKEAATKETGKRAADAKAALTDLAPTGKTWQQYADMIDTGYEQNKVTYKAKVSENHIWLLDAMRDDFAAAGLSGTLDKKKVEELASDIKTVRGFTRLVKMASFCVETEEFIDAKDGKTKKRYTVAAKHGQKILNDLASPNLVTPGSKDKLWEKLFDITSDIEFSKRSTWIPLIDKLNKQEEAKAKASGKVSLGGFDLSGIQLALQETPIADQQGATALLNQRGVTVAATGGEMILPPEVKHALSMVKKSAAIAA